MHPQELSIKDFTYDLPEEKIASQPLEERDASKLLVYRDGLIEESQYSHLAEHLPENSLLVFNNTKVIAARILFQKPTGGVIEIFCLEPYEDNHDYALIMAKQGKVRWKCLIGGASKWKSGSLEKTTVLANGESIKLAARLIERLTETYVVELSWEPASLSFAEVISSMGSIPLPPYIKRKAGETDKVRYQTVYARHEGSVAAPTAGLHFTPAIFEALKARKISQAYVTLHVGAGTFKPVKAASMAGHEMHAEWIDVSLSTIQTLIQKLDDGIIAVGTTSVRTLESLYWMGARIFNSPEIEVDQLAIRQWDVYEAPLMGVTLKAAEALSALVAWMEKNGLDRLITQTQILIAPGYRFRIPIAIITNFHQPQSTLLLLVAAAIGSDWKRVYNHALANDFRFLSYGDGCLLFLDRTR